ncbi:MAG: NAD-dependent malic enzyme [Planctomycetota bacterium]
MTNPTLPHHDIGDRRGIDILHDPILNKGTAFTPRERDALGIRGLLPPRVFTEAEQVGRSLQHLRKLTSDLDRYMALQALCSRNETLFFRLLYDHVDEFMPIVYTPTVGEACQKYGHIFQRSQGLYVSAADRGRIARVLRNWPVEDVRVIVVTDGSRILGLGDLGAQGMGIPVGKLTLYTVCAGVHPRYCLPITLDVGTDNQTLRDDPLYIGLQQPRLDGDAYDSFVHEFVEAVKEVFPRALLQFEDFSNKHAFRLLQRYRDDLCCFNDDMQGTASVALAGIYSALRVTGGALADQRILFYGAGEAGIGTADLFCSATGAGGGEEASKQCWFYDSKGLVVEEREGLTEHKRRYAHPHRPVRDLLEAVTVLRPTILIGVSGQPQTFTRPIVEKMAEMNERPVIFALSNPTSKAECTAEQAYTWSRGKAVFATGSPFPAFSYEGRELVPGQANNAYIFPGLGLGIVASGARRVVDGMFIAAARKLAELVRPEMLERGCLFPPLSRIREVSSHIAAAVAEIAFDEGLASVERPENILEWIRGHVYEPDYPSYA